MKVRRRAGHDPHPDTALIHWLRAAAKRLAELDLANRRHPDPLAPRSRQTAGRTGYGHPCASLIHWLRAAAAQPSASLKFVANATAKRVNIHRRLASRPFKGNITREL